MKKLPSKLFPNCEFSENTDAGFFDIIPEGFNDVIFLYLSDETTSNDNAIEKAASFFDKITYWDTQCRNIFLSFEQDSEDYQTVEQYFDFYKDEVPEVFAAEDVSSLSLSEMIDSLKLKGIASHGNGDEQKYVVDFTLGYDQILCVKFDSECNFDSIGWES